MSVNYRPWVFVCGIRILSRQFGAEVVRTSKAAVWKNFADSIIFNAGYFAV
jgi:hypothetical protein